MVSRTRTLVCEAANKATNELPPNLRNKLPLEFHFHKPLLEIVKWDKKTIEGFVGSLVSHFENSAGLGEESKISPKIMELVKMFLDHPKALKSALETFEAPVSWTANPKEITLGVNRLYDILILFKDHPDAVPAIAYPISSGQFDYDAQKATEVVIELKDEIIKTVYAFERGSKVQEAVIGAIKDTLFNSVVSRETKQSTLKNVSKVCGVLCSFARDSERAEEAANKINFAVMFCFTKGEINGKLETACNEMAWGGLAAAGQALKNSSK